MIDEIPDVREIDDSRHPAFDFRIVHPEHQTFQVNVLTTGQDVFQSLGHTLQWPASKWRVLDAAHQKRNLAEYEGFLEIEESTITELQHLANELIADVEKLVISP